MAGLGDAIPSQEAFTVVGQDTVVTGFDAWYTSGSTVSQDRFIANLETGLFVDRGGASVAERQSPQLTPLP